MGRGRAKAKQTKVARELKYSTGALDINALTAELSTSDSDETAETGESDEDEGFDGLESDEDAEHR
jgi:hypothetical protein